MPLEEERQPGPAEEPASNTENVNRRQADERILYPVDQAVYDLRTFEASAGHPVIRGVTYEEPLIFKDSKLVCGISFVNVTFKQEVNFSRTVVEGPLYFWNCRFEGKVSFFRVRTKGDCRPVQWRLPGEINFSYSRFEAAQADTEQPSFDRAFFAGPAFFHRTVFCNGVSAEEARFDGGALFEGFRSDICISNAVLMTFASSKTIRILSSKLSRILAVNTDHEDHWNFDWTIRSVESLRTRIRLADPSLSQACEAVQPSSLDASSELPELRHTVQELMNTWELAFNRTMFGGCCGKQVSDSSFRGAYFGGPSSFRQVDLGNCRFQGANISDVEFLVVDWARQPCGLLFRRLLKPFPAIGKKLVQTDRAALRDELVLDIDAQWVMNRSELASRRKELSELYRDLRIAYEKEGDSHIGRDFYFGELEAERLSFPTIKRTVGLSHWYKIFSGYSKREGLALCWLLGTLFIGFPFLFWLLINVPEHRLLSIPLRYETAPSGAETCRVPSPQTPSFSPPLVVGEPGKHLLGEEQRHYEDVMSKAMRASWGRGRFKSIALRALGSSLQASTFLPPSLQRDSSIDAAIVLQQSVRCPETTQERKFVSAAGTLIGLEAHKRALEGLERLVVPAQLGLFLLALRSKFQRTH